MIPVNELRESIKSQRDALTPERCLQAASRISSRLIALDAFEQSHDIALYIAHRHEVDTTDIVAQAWQSNKRIYLPVLADDRHHLYFVAYTPDTVLVKNRYGIFEPAYAPEQRIDVTDLDLVITPLVAFDEECHRIGMGAGFYDRTFSFLNQSPRPPAPLMIGLAYDFQKQTQLQRMPWDVNLNMIITDTQIIVPIE